MERFVQDYLATVTVDPRLTYEQLAPDFQEQSGGLGGYQGFWRTVSTASPRDVRADPERMTVSYGVDYVMTNGAEFSDDVTLQLEYVDGGYRITGER
jgi:hypothetical protein